MEKYESKIKVVKASPEDIYAIMTDLSQVNGILPSGLSDKIKDAQVSADECSFDIDKIGRVALKIADRQPCSLVKYALSAAMSLGINLFLQIKEAPQASSEPESRIKVSLTADIPFMLKPLIGGKLQEIVDRVAETVAMKSYK